MKFYKKCCNSDSNVHGAVIISQAKSDDFMDTDSVGFISQNVLGYALILSTSSFSVILFIYFTDCGYTEKKSIPI